MRSRSPGPDDPKRRALVRGGLAAALAGPLAGCTSDRVLEEPSCPEPDLENPQEFEDHGRVQDQDVQKLLAQGAELVTAADEPAADWIEPDVDYDRECAIIAVVGAGGSPSQLEVLGVDRFGDRVTLYTCWRRQSNTDEFVPLARLVTVPHDGDPPDEVALKAAEVDETRGLL